MIDFIAGILTMGYIVSGIFFLRFWRDSRDRLFAMFGAAFFILAVHRIGLEFCDDLLSERTTLWYLVRLLAFLIIIVAIVDKNRKK